MINFHLKNNLQKHQCEEVHGTPPKIVHKEVEKRVISTIIKNVINYYYYYYYYYYLICSKFENEKQTFPFN